MLVGPFCLRIFPPFLAFLSSPILSLLLMVGVVVFGGRLPLTSLAPLSHRFFRGLSRIGRGSSLFPPPLFVSLSSPFSLPLICYPVTEVYSLLASLLVVAPPMRRGSNLLRSLLLGGSLATIDPIATLRRSRPFLRTHLILDLPSCCLLMSATIAFVPSFPPWLISFFCSRRSSHQTTVLAV